MAEFDQRIQQIQRSVDELTSSLKNVESAVEQASKEFESMSRNAESINQVASSVSKLERLVDRLEKSPFTEKLREQISQMNNELQKLDTGRLESVTSAIQAQTQAQRTLNQVQININNNFRRTKEIVDTMVASLGTLSQAAESLGTRATTSITGIGTALEAVSAHEQQVNAVISALNALDPNKYDQSAQALRAVAEAAERISKANINISQVKQNQPRTGPTDAAQKYAAEHNIDLSQYEGRVTLRQLRADSQKTPIATPPQEVQGVQAEAQRRIDHYNKLYDRAQQYDKVIAGIATAQSKAIDAALSNRGIDDPKLQQQFREAILSGDKSKQYDLGKEYRSKFLDVKQVYEQKLSEGSVSTELDKFKEVSLTDEAMIKEIVRYRRLLSEKGQDIKRQLEQANQPTQDLPSFSRGDSGGITNVREFLRQYISGSDTKDALPEVNDKEIQHELAVLRQHLQVENDIIGSELDRLRSKVAASPNEVINISKGDIRRDVRSAYKGFDADRESLAVFKQNYIQRQSGLSASNIEAQLPDALSATEVSKTYKTAQEQIIESEKQAADELIKLKERFSRDPNSFSNEKITGSYRDFHEATPYVNAQLELQEFKSRFAQRAGAEPVTGTIPSVQSASVVTQLTQQTTRSYVQQFLESLKSVFTRLKENIQELFSSAGKISFGDIAQRIKLMFTAPQQATEGPSFALSDVRKTSDNFSKNFYRPFSYGVSQFGAGLNSVREFTKGAQQGGPGGLLDMIGGVIKFLHTLASSNNFFKLGILPKGIGDLFNSRRSDTLLDIAEFGIGMKTGYRRGDLNRRYREMADKEQPLAESVADLRSKVADETIPAEERVQLRSELDKQIQELKELRRAINAYKLVLEDEAKAKSSESTGKSLDAPSFARSFQESLSGTRSVVASYMSDQQKLLSNQAQAALQKFSGNTGLKSGIGAGVALVDQKQVLDLVKQFYGEGGIQGISASSVKGVSIPVLDEMGKRISSIIVSATGQALDKGDRAEVLVHEAIHELTEAANRGGRDVYAKGTYGYGFTDKSLELSRLKRLSGVSDVGIRQQLAGQSQGAGVLSGVGRDADNLNYYFDPREMFAHIGQAMISGNKQLESELVQLYGKDLYDKVVNELKTKLPDTFSDANLQQLQGNFKDFSAEIDTLFAQAAPDPAKAKQGIDDAFEQLFAGFKLPANLVSNVAKSFEDLFPSIAAVIKSPESVSRIGSAVSALFYNEGSFKDILARSASKSGANDALKTLGTAALNPTQDNIKAAIKSVQESPALIRGTVEQYVRQTLEGKPVQGLTALYASKRPGVMVKGLLDQFIPDQTSFRDQLNEEAQKLTGKNIRAGTYQQQVIVDPSSGLKKFAISAQTADGAMLSLNARVDEFGNKKLDKPTEEMGRFGNAIREFAIGVPRELGQEFAYGITNQFQEMIRQLISIQDELNEVANLLNVVGDAATKAKSNFLFQSVNTAVATGQGFDEAIQSNLKNFKTLGVIKNTGQREQLANQISEVQLGAQTAFGLTLEQSLEVIPSILSVIKDGMENITDPAEQTVEAVKQLRDVMDQVVVAQRASGASGDELLLIYSRLAQSAKEYGLNSQQLLGIAASSSTSIGKGGEENANILRSFLEGTYSQANASSFAQAGIATKNFNPATNQIENRSFELVLRDLYAMSQDQSKAVDYNQLLQSIAGPARKVDISKAILGFGRNYDVGQEDLSATKQGTFSRLVTQKSENLQGSLNKLGATGTQFLGSLLVGTGGFDRAAKLFDTLSESALKLTTFLNQNEGSIKKVVDALLPFIKFFTISQLSKDLNIFSPLAKGLGIIEKNFQRTFAIMTDFGKEGESSGTRLQKVLNLVSVTLQELNAGFAKTGNTAVASFSRAGDAAVKASNQMTASFALAPTSLDSETPIRDRLNRMKGEVVGSTFGQGDLSQIRGERSGFSQYLNQGREILDTASRPSRLSQLRASLERPGAIAGSLAAPVGFDLLSGGLGNDNLINTAGAGIAGAFAGALTGPQGAIIGYTLAQSFLSNIDLPGAFGTSEKEYDALANAIINKGRTPEEAKPQEQREAEKKVLDVGIDEFKRAISFDTLFSQRVSVGGQSEELGKFKVSSQDVADYKRLVVEGQRNGIGDELRARVITLDDTIKGVYETLAQNRTTLDTYIQAGVSDFSEFQQRINEAQSGEGPLADLIKEKGYSAQQQSQTDSAISAKNDELKNERALLEASTDIIEKINADLTEFQTTTSKMREIPLGLTQYGELGSKTLELDKRFAPQLEGIRSGKITGQDAQRLLQQYDTSRASYTALPQSLQTLLPLAQNLGLNTQGLEQKLYNVGAEGQGQLVQRFGQADQANQFVQDYESRQRALKQYESSDLYKARDAAIVKEHDNLKKALATDQARYTINKQYLDLIKAQANILLDQTDSIQKQTQARQLISAGTPAQFNPLSLFDTQGYSAGQINKAIEAALEKQRQLEKLSPGYKKYFGEQQFLLQGQGGFKPVTGIDQNFMQQALQSQQIKPPSLEDLSQFSDVELQKILGRARSLQSQAVSLNPDLAGRYDDERLLIFRKNNQLLQEVGLSQEYLKLAIQENTKSNDTLRGHYNLPSSYRAPTVWDYYASGGKETGDVNFPNKTGQGSMVPLSFAQQLAQEFLNASKASKGGADLSEITTTAGPGSTGKPRFYSGGSPAVYSEPIPQVLPDTVRLPQAPQPSARQEIEAFKHELAVQAREQRAAQQKSLHSYDDIETKRLGKQESKGPLDAVKDALDKTRQTLGLTDDKIKDLGAGAAAVGLTLTGFTSSAGTLALNTNAFSSAITSLLAKVQTFDLVRAMKASNIQIHVTVNGETQKASQVTINNTSGGGTGALTAQPAAKTRIS